MGRSLHREVKIERLRFGIINFMSRWTVRLLLGGFGGPTMWLLLSTIVCKAILVHYCPLFGRFCPQLYNEGVFVRKSPHVDHFCLQSSSRRPFPSTIVSKHANSGPNTL